ncbi:MAG: hypothetical protein IAF38_13615 [Bacteroidia bacterium]|nr:hypothetical protein [Bacteroidia bacterium]
MWSSLKTETEKNVTKYTINQNEKAITNQEAIELLRGSDKFERFFSDLLSASPYEAYFWEVKSVSLDRLDDKFEFVLVNSPILAKINADNSSFVNYFGKNKFVTSFFNLSGDSRLIVPVEMSDSTNYSHLSKFVRNAPTKQVEAFWKTVGEEFGKSIGVQKKWLSTSGLGVHWLHVRIDERPKYYNYLKYKE